MWILMVYVFIVVISELIVVAIGLALDRTYPLLSLPVSLSLFFAVIWFGWILAVRWTEPKRAKSVKLGAAEKRAIQEEADKRGMEAWMLKEQIYELV